MLSDELTLKDKMEQSYLIQRLVKPLQWKIKGKTIDNPFSFGGGLKNGGLSENAMELLRPIFSFDYMGSAEFEWGAVPQALRFLGKQAAKKNLVAHGLKLNNDEIVYFLSPKSYQEDVKDRIKLLREEKVHLKERCCLKDYFESDREWNKKYVGWLELDNGFMFFVDKEAFLNVCKLFEINYT